MTASSSIRRASGSCTFESVCQRVAPSAVRRLDRVRRHAADAERGDADRRRDRVDHRRHDRRARADREEDHDRHQVGERRDDLHRVEHRRDRRAGSGRSGRRATPSGMPIASESADRREHQRERLHARLPEAERGERDERERATPSAARAAAEAQHDRACRAPSCPTHVSLKKNARQPADEVVEEGREAVEDAEDDARVRHVAVVRRARSGSCRGRARASSTSAPPATAPGSSSRRTRRPSPSDDERRRRRACRATTGAGAGDRRVRRRPRATAI